MADNKLNLLVRFTGVDKLSGAVRNIMSSSKSGNAAVRALSAEIKNLGKQQKTAESFRKLKSELDQTRKGMEEASQRATRLGREIAQAEKPTKAMRAEFAKAKREAAALKAKFVEQTGALKATRGALAGAGIDTRRLGDHQRQLAQRIEAANRRLEQQRQRMARVSAIQTRMGKLGGRASIAGAAMSAGVTAPGMAIMNGVGNLATETRAKANAANVGGMDMVQFQRNAQAARSVGIEFDKYGDILKDTQDKIGDFTANGGGEMKDFFNNVGQKVGVTAKSFKNLSGAESLQLYYNSLVKAGVSQKEMVFYMEAIADEGSALIPLLANNGAKMRELGDAAAIVTPTDAAALAEYTEAQRALETSTTKLQIALAKSGLIEVMTWITDKGTQAAEWFGSLSPEVQKVAVVMGLVAGIAGPVLIAFGMIASAIGFLAPLFSLVGTAILAVVGVVGAVPLLIAAGVIAVGALIYAYWDQITAAFNTGIAKVKGFFNTLPGWMQNIGMMVMEGLLMAISPGRFVTRMISIAKAGVTAFKDYFGIKSPSRLFMEMGGHINAGLDIGLGKSQARPIAAASRMAAAVASAGTVSMAAPIIAQPMLAPLVEQHRASPINEIGAMQLPEHLRSKPTPIAPAASTRGAAAQPLSTGKVEIKVYQQPGEEGEALARRVADIIERRKPRGGGGGSSFQDDF